LEQDKPIRANRAQKMLLARIVHKPPYELKSSSDNVFAQYGVYWVAGVGFLGHHSVGSGMINRAKTLDIPSIQSFKYLYPAQR
jgi:hypothetical protein